MQGQFTATLRPLYYTTVVEVALRDKENQALEVYYITVFSFIALSSITLYLKIEIQQIIQEV